MNDRISSKERVKIGKKQVSNDFVAGILVYLLCLSFALIYKITGG